MYLRSLYLLIPLLSLGCGDTSTEETGAEPPLPALTSTLGCGDTDPIIDSLDISDYGYYECEKGAGVVPSILIEVAVRDDDLDLHTYKLDLWWDDTVDNDIAPDAEDYTIERTLSTSECTVGQTNIGVILCLGGSSLGFSQATEFAAIVYDDERNPSNFGEPTFASYTTQAE